MAKSLWRPGGEKHDVAHRAWNSPETPGLCHKCLRPLDHPIHWKKFRETKNWFGWKGAL